MKEKFQTTKTVSKTKMILGEKVAVLVIIFGALSAMASFAVFFGVSIQNFNKTAKEQNKTNNTIRTTETLFEPNNPQTSAVDSDIVFLTKPSNINPIIDGNIEGGEVADAFHQTITGSNSGTFDVYSKTVVVNNARQIYLGMKIQHSTILPNTAKWVTLYFDEGNDGSFGSGSKDNQLIVNQEDLKEISNGGGGLSCQNFFGIVEGCPTPSCTPQNQQNCWQCQQNYTVYGPNLWTGSTCINTGTQTTQNALNSNKTNILDGFWNTSSYGTGWYAGSVFSNYNFVNYFAYKKEYNGYLDVEFLLPWAGVDKLANPHNVFEDSSDINVNHGNILGLGIRVLLGASQETVLPSTLDRFIPTTYADLEIKNCYDTDGGDIKNTKGTVSYFDNRENQLTYVAVDDYCINNNTVMENWCSTIGLAAGGARTCPSGCTNGKCSGQNPVSD